MSLISRTSRRLLLSAMPISRPARSGSSPATPPASSPSEPAIEVSGVRSSWLTVETNSALACSARRRSVQSRITATAWTPSG
ncbi:hypothetical protein LRS10_06430 [Phenylobacterium sp. J426]|nr:hypothetical protein [Phenylobacterium sp. J426]MCR5873845.1 hypothetical protein [Phenylobacterium sp. J426]